MQIHLNKATNEQVEADDRMRQKQEFPSSDNPLALQSQQPHITSHKLFRSGTKTAMS